MTPLAYLVNTCSFSQKLVCVRLESSALIGRDYQRRLWLYSLLSCLFWFSVTGTEETLSVIVFFSLQFPKIFFDKQRYLGEKGLQ